MIYLKVEKIDNTKALVKTQFYDISGLSQEEIAELIPVEEIPNAELIKGKSALLYINLADNSLYYEYIDRQLSPDEITEERLSSIEIAMAQMLGM